MRPARELAQLYRVWLEKLEVTGSRQGNGLCLKKKSWTHDSIKVSFLGQTGFQVYKLVYLVEH